MFKRIVSPNADGIRNKFSNAINVITKPMLSRPNSLLVALTANILHLSVSQCIVLCSHGSYNPSVMQLMRMTNMETRSNHV